MYGGLGGRWSPRFRIERFFFFFFLNCRNPGGLVTCVNSETRVKGQFVLGNLNGQIFIECPCTLREAGGMLGHWRSASWTSWGASESAHETRKNDSKSSGLNCSSAIKASSSFEARWHAGTGEVRTFFIGRIWEKEWEGPPDDVHGTEFNISRAKYCFLSRAQTA